MWIPTKSALLDTNKLGSKSALDINLSTDWKFYSSHIIGTNLSASAFMIGLSLIRSLDKLYNMKWTYFYGIIIFNNLYVIHLTLGLLFWNSLVNLKNNISSSYSLNSIPWLNKYINLTNMFFEFSSVILESLNSYVTYIIYSLLT